MDSDTPNSVVHPKALLSVAMCTMHLECVSSTLILEEQGKAYAHLASPSEVVFAKL